MKIVGAVDGFKIRCERKGGNKVCDATHLKEQSCHKEDGGNRRLYLGVFNVTCLLDI